MDNIIDNKSNMENDYKNIVSVKFARALQPKFEERKGKGVY